MKDPHLVINWLSAEVRILRNRKEQLSKQMPDSGSGTGFGLHDLPDPELHGMPCPFSEIRNPAELHLDSLVGRSTCPVFSEIPVELHEMFGF